MAFAGRLVTVVVVPDPVVVVPPGLRVRVHVPDDGRPLNATLPVDVAHVGCVIVPTMGADGAVQGVKVYFCPFAGLVPIFVVNVLNDGDGEVPLPFKLK